jgi:hypothetical protein
MDYRGYTIISVKLFGIWLFVKGILAVPQLYGVMAAFRNMPGEELDLGYIVLSGSVIFLPILFGLALFFATGRYGRYLHGSKSETHNLPYESQIFFSIALCLLGIYFMASAILDFVFLVPVISVAWAYKETLWDVLFSSQSNTEQIGAPLIHLIFQMLFGALLVAKSGFIVSKLRHAIWDAIKFPPVSEEPKSGD